ncbi:MAG: ATP-binding protein [Cyclobacteriaceae bacterium]
MEIQRLKEERLLKSLAHFPCVGILGPRQCGKTTLSKLLMDKLGKQAVYLDMESERDRSALSSPELFFDQHMDECIVLDEIQVHPDLFPILRSSIDKNRVPGRFILLGSSSPHLLRKSNESLAGRESYHELSPFNLLEIDKPLQHRLTGGYPECYLFEDVDISFEWLANYVASYVQRELPALGLNTHPHNIQKLLTMLAHVHGNLLNIEQLSGSLGISATSVRNYLGFIEDAFLIRRLKPFHANLKKRLVKSPKVYIRDVGVLHQLLGIGSRKDYEFSPQLGASWEGYVIEQILQLLPAPYLSYFYRTHQGTECHLVITKGDQPIISVEVKYTAAPKMTKSFTTAIDDLGTKNNFIIVPREEDFPLTDNVQVVGLETFLKNIILDL